MRNVTLTFDDGSTHTYNNVPLSVTPEQIMARATNEFQGKTLTNIDGGRKAASGNSENIPDFPNTPQGKAQMKAWLAAQAPPFPQAATSPTPKNEIPVLAERDANPSAIAGMNAYRQSEDYASPQRIEWNRIANEARKLEAQLADLQGTPNSAFAGPGQQFRRGQVPPAKMEQISSLKNRIEALRGQLPTDWSDVGNVIGQVGGGLFMGAATAPAAPATAGFGTAAAVAAGATVGGFIGRALGALRTIETSQMTNAEKRLYLDEKLGVKQILIDAGLNIVFMGAGGVLGTIGKNTAAGRRIMAALGIGVEKVPKGTAKPGQSVYNEEGALPNGLPPTTAAEAQQAADAAALRVSSGDKVLPRGAIEGKSGLLESRAEQINPQAFKRSREAVEADIEKDLADFRRGIVGEQTGETGGHTFGAAARGMDATVDEYVGPIYARMRAAGGGEPMVDISALRASAQAIKDKAAPGTLRGEAGQLIDDILKNGDRISFEQAHSLQSTWAARVRDLKQPGQGDENASRLLNQYANDMRSSLMKSLDDAATRVEQQSELFRGGAGATDDAAASLQSSATATTDANAAAAAARGERIQQGYIPGEQVEIGFGQGTSRTLNPARASRNRANNENQELFTTAGPAGQNSIRAAEQANAERVGRISAYEGDAADAAGNAATRAFGRGQQQEILAARPTVDPRLPADLRQASSLYRDMNEGVYSTTGSRALRAEENRGAEHIGSTIYAKGNTTAIRELDAMEALAKRIDDLPLDSAARKNLEKRAAEMGFDVSRPLAVQVAEARRGMIGDFLQENMGSAAAIRNLPERMKTDPKFRRTFEATIRDPAQRQTIERISQAAQMAGRVGESTGSVQGTAYGLSLVGGSIGFAFGSTPGALAGAAAMYWGPRFLAHAMTSPSYKALLSRNSAFMLRAAQGGGGSAVPDFVQQMIEKAKLDGFDLTKPEQ